MQQANEMIAPPFVGNCTALGNETISKLELDHFHTINGNSGGSHSICLLYVTLFFEHILLLISYLFMNYERYWVRLMAMNANQQK